MMNASCVLIGLVSQFFTLDRGAAGASRTIAASPVVIGRIDYDVGWIAGVVHTDGAGADRLFRLAETASAEGR